MSKIKKSILWWLLIVVLVLKMYLTIELNYPINYNIGKISLMFILLLIVTRK